MKKNQLFTLLIALIFYATAWAQPTSFGGYTYPVPPNTAGTGGNNTNSYFGHNAGFSNTGFDNTFIGSQSGYNNTSGHGNTITGVNALYFNTTGYENTAAGFEALYSNTTGSYNIATGYQALYSNTTGGSNTATGYLSLFFNTTGHGNTATGSDALLFNTMGWSNTATGVGTLFFNTTGWNNTATGGSALSRNTTGNENTATGYYALYSNTAGNYNTANGSHALSSNDTGGYNTAAGYYALYSNTLGSDNTANGKYALYSNTIGESNTAMGRRALYSNTDGSFNTATGFEALSSNTSGNNNIATGRNALYSNTTGSENTAAGFNALSSNTTGNNNTAMGRTALSSNTTGEFNTAIGFSSGPNNGGFNNTTALGRGAIPTASDQVRIGNTSVTSIGGAVNWSVVSDGRFKKDIQEDIPGLDFITRLRPVSYDLNRTKIRAFLGKEETEESTTAQSSSREIGFVAQEVEQLLNENGYTRIGIETPQNDRDHYGIRYAEFVVPLTKAVQELSEKDKAQQELIETLQQEIETLKAMVYGTGGTSATALKEAITLPEGFLLEQNIPNPFNETTIINAEVPETVGEARIVIYNLQGVELRSYPLTRRGRIAVEVEGGAFTSGMYLYALLADGQLIDTKKMVLTK